MIRVPSVPKDGHFKAAGSEYRNLSIEIPEPDPAMLKVQTAADVTRDLQAWRAAGTAWEEAYTASHTGGDARNAVEDARAFHQEQFWQLKQKYSGNPVATRHLHDQGNILAHESIGSMQAHAGMESEDYITSVLAGEERELRELMRSPYSSDLMRKKAFAAYVFKMENWMQVKGEQPEAIDAWKEAIRHDIVSEGLHARFDRILDDDPREAVKLVQFARGEEVPEGEGDPLRREQLRVISTEYGKFMTEGQLQLLYNRADAERQFRTRLAEQRANEIHAKVEASMLNAMDGGDLSFFHEAQQDLIRMERPDEAQSMAVMSNVMTMLQPCLESTRFIPFNEQCQSVLECLARMDAPAEAHIPAAEKALAIIRQGIFERENRFIRDPAGYIASHLLLGQDGMSTEEFRKLDNITQEEYFTRSLRLQHVLGRDLPVSPSLLPRDRATAIRDRYDSMEATREKAELLHTLTNESGKYSRTVLAEAGLPLGVTAFANVMPALSLSQTAKLAEAAESDLDSMQLPETRKAAIRERVAASSLALGLLHVDSALTGTELAGYEARDAINTLENFVALGGNLADLERQVVRENTQLAWDIAEITANAIHDELAVWLARDTLADETDEAGRSLLEQQAHEIGVGIRGVVDGMTSAADFVASPVRELFNAVNEVLGGAPGYIPPIGSSISDALGLPLPESAWQEITHAINKGGTEAITTIWGANALLSHKLANNAPNVFTSVVESFRSGPAAQIASGAGAETAAVAAQQAGSNPVGTIAASLGGGLLGGKIGSGKGIASNATESNVLSMSTAERRSAQADKILAQHEPPWHARPEANVISEKLSAKLAKLPQGGDFPHNPHNKGKGSITVEKGAKPDKTEMAAAKAFADKGYNVTRLAEAGRISDGIKTPDLHIESFGRVEVYTPAVSNSDNIVRNFEKKRKQSGMFLVQASISITEMEEISKRMFNKPTCKSLTLIFFESGTGKIHTYKK